MIIMVHKQKYSRRNESLSKIYKFDSNESNQCKSITGLGFGNGLSLYQSQRQPISSNNYQYNY